MKKQTRGSALVWVIVVVTAMEITVLAALGISYAYYHRAMQNNSERQAYLSAKGIIEDIVEKIELNDQNYLTLFEGLEENEKTYLTIELDSQLGRIPTLTSYIESLPKEDKKGNITISITAVFDEEDYTIKADMSKGRVGDVEKWQLVKFYQGEHEEAKSGNIDIASKMLSDMKKLGECWLNPKGDTTLETCMLNELKKDETAYANLMESKPDYRISKNNDVLRTAFYYKNKPGSWPIFDKSLVKNEKYRKLLEANPNNYYIQPYFTHGDYKNFIVYAKAQDANDLINTWYNVQLFYDSGHWYYVEKTNYADYINGGTGSGVVSIQQFEGSTTDPTNSSIEKWNRFKEKYLTPENRLD